MIVTLLIKSVLILFYKVIILNLVYFRCVTHWGAIRFLLQIYTPEPAEGHCGLSGSLLYVTPSIWMVSVDVQPL